MAQVSYPGVYIEEFAPAPPIQPAATSVAAFVGFADPNAPKPAPINEPLRITSFAQFRQRFGARPVSGFYLWYAVRGFFENGGTDCFVVRASNGKPATWIAKNSEENPVYRITTRKAQSSAGITLAVSDANPLGARSLKTLAKTFSIAAEERDALINSRQRELEIEEGHLLRPGDLVKNGETNSRVVRVIPGKGLDGNPSANSLVTFDSPFTALGGTNDAPTLDLSDLDSKTTVLRVKVDGDTGDSDPAILDCLSAGTIVEFEDAKYFIDQVQAESCFLNANSPITTTYRLQLRTPLRLDAPINQGDGNERDVSIIEKKLVLTIDGVSRDIFVSPDASSSHFAPDRSDPLLQVTLESFDTDPSKLIPVDGNLDVEAGVAEDSSTFRSGGANLLSDAIEHLQRVPEVNMLAVPDACGLDSTESKNMVMQAIIAHCETMAERFGVLDAHAPNQEMFEKKVGKQSIEEQMGASRSTRGYAALYYPWIRTRPAGGGRVLATVPPSGHVCGLLARVDKSRGVHKAPGNETLNDAVAITQNMTDQEQGVLNLQGINVIRTFTSGGRPIVFGARTTASDKNWQYVNIRRLFLFLEESIAANLRTSLFEPNNTELWGKLNRVITAFLTQQWQDGALFGKKADEAFYVKIDEELNPSDQRRLGMLNIEIGVQPTFPAEFIVVRIGIWDGGMSVSEG